MVHDVRRSGVYGSGWWVEHSAWCNVVYDGDGGRSVYDGRGDVLACG